MLPISPLQPEGGVTVQFQAGVEPLLTVAANCWDAPMVIVGAAGVTVTVTAGGGGFVVATGPPPPPPQPAAAAHTTAPMSPVIFRSIFAPPAKQQSKSGFAENCSWPALEYNNFQ